MIKNHNQSGQTLIETIVALFVLTMALVAGLSLALYATTKSAQTRDQVIATNLAKEGLEVARIMRDSNWLMAEDTSTGQDDLYTTGDGCTFPTSNSGSGNVRRFCYPMAFVSPNPLAPSSSLNDYRVLFTPSSNTGWTLDTLSTGVSENYLLCLEAPYNMYLHNDQGGTVCTIERSQFARRVTISVGNTSFPFTQYRSNPAPTGNRSAQFGGHSPELVVTSTVVWKGKNCTAYTATVNPVTLSTKCKVTVTERLTNWKDYR